MKRRILAIALVAICLLTLASCGCKHEWAEANCTDPSTCTLCGATEGAPLGHTWQAATCAAPKSCEVCGQTQGEALSHAWEAATCDTPKTCADCGVTEGDPLGHSWLDATYEAPKTCETCGTTEGEPLVKTTPDFMASNSYTSICQIIDSNMGTMNPEYSYDEDSNIFYIYLTAPEGTAYALSVSPDAVAESWETLRTSLADLTSSAQTLFISEGFTDVSCCIMLLNDANTENVLLGLLDGQIVFDVMDE